MIIIYQHNIIYLLDRSNAQLTSYSIKSTSTPYYYELFPQLFSTLRHFIQFFLQATLAASQKIHPLPVLPSIFQHNLLLFHGAIGPILCVQKSPFLSPHFRFQCHPSLDFFSDGSVCSCSCQRHFHHFPPTLQFKEVVTIRHETCFHDTIEIKLKPVFRTPQPILLYILNNSQLGAAVPVTSCRKAPRMVFPLLRSQSYVPTGSSSLFFLQKLVSTTWHQIGQGHSMFNSLKDTC